MPSLDAVLALLPDGARIDRTLRADAGPWAIAFGHERWVLRVTDLATMAKLGMTGELARASTEWLHVALTDLERTGFVAPAPVRSLHGASIAVQGPYLWELLTFVPGTPSTWTSSVYGSGRALARLHDAAARMPRRAQRPGALPLDACRPTHPDAPVEAFREELAQIGYASAPRLVIHGDGTNANTVRDGTEIRFVDYALAYCEVALVDLGCALWRTGRVGPDGLTYDTDRAAAFVRGYASVRPLGRTDAHRIVVYLKGRGLQLQHRAERRGRNDVTIMQRLLSVVRQQAALEAAIAAALD